MFQGLLQATGQDRTGIYVAVAVLAIFAILGIYFLIRSSLDRASGAYETEATYVLGRGQHPELVEIGAGEVVPRETHRLGRDGLQELVRKVESRNDMGIDHLVLDDGDTVPYVTAKGSLERAERVVLSDSRGEITVDTDGRITARPPLDPAVRQDLAELLVDVIGPADEIHGT